MARKQIQGTCYIIDYYERKLRIFDTYTGEEFNSIPLPGKAKDFKPDDFDSWGNESVILSTTELQKESEIPL